MTNTNIKTIMEHIPLLLKQLQASYNEIKYLKNTSCEDKVDIESLYVDFDELKATADIIDKTVNNLETLIEEKQEMETGIISKIKMYQINKTVQKLMPLKNALVFEINQIDYFVNLFDLDGQPLVEFADEPLVDFSQMEELGEEVVELGKIIRETIKLFRLLEKKL